MKTRSKVSGQRQKPQRSRQGDKLASLLSEVHGPHQAILAEVGGGELKCSSNSATAKRVISTLTTLPWTNPIAAWAERLCGMEQNLTSMKADLTVIKVMLALNILLNVVILVFAFKV